MEYSLNSMPIISTKEWCTSIVTTSKQPGSTSAKLQSSLTNKNRMWMDSPHKRKNFSTITMDFLSTTFYSTITKSNTTLLCAIFYRKIIPKLTKVYSKLSTVCLRVKWKMSIKNYLDCLTFKFRKVKFRILLEKKLKYCHSLYKTDCVQSSLKFCCLFRSQFTQRYFSVFPTSKNQTLYQNSRKKFWNSSACQQYRSNLKLPGFVAQIKESFSLMKWSNMTFNFHNPPHQKKRRALKKNRMNSMSTTLKNSLKKTA